MGPPLRTLEMQMVSILPSLTRNQFLPQSGPNSSRAKPVHKEGTLFKIQLKFIEAGRESTLTCFWAGF
jgi:hypothetical protein